MCAYLTVPVMGKAISHPLQEKGEREIFLSLEIGGPLEMYLSKELLQLRCFGESGRIELT